MKIIYLISIVSLISACAPTKPNQVALQQNYICKSLISGFLKTQNLSHYELSSIKPTLSEAAEQRIYIYRTSSDIGMRFNMPSQTRLNFSCDHNQNQYALNLIRNEQQIHLMSLSVPPADQLKQWTAYSLKNQ